MSEALKKAEALLVMDPLPDDAEEQMEALAKLADSEIERSKFSWLFEGLFTRRQFDSKPVQG